MKTLVRCCERYISPLKVAEIFKDENGFAFLESSLISAENRYAIMGIHPYWKIEERNGVAYVNGESRSERFEALLAAALEANGEENDTDLPLIAGGIGCFSYDFGRRFEGIPLSHPPAGDMPTAVFCFYDHLLIFDLLAQKMYLTAKGFLAPAESALDELERKILSADVTPEMRQTAKAATFRFDFCRSDYEAAVRKMIERIIAGDIYIANLSQRLFIDGDMTPFELYRRLRQRNPSPFGGYLDHGDFQLVCASPERFLRLRHRCMETRPIKGTRPRGKTKKEDEAFRAELERSAKDRSELLMIVDLERNDFNRVCVPGSVQVRDMFYLESYATVFHLVATVVGKVAADVTYAELLPALFPGGSISGAPKIAAMKIIDELEHSARGFYTGSLGYISANGDCDLNIMIRTAVRHGDRYTLGIGGGITAESDPGAEYRETLTKAKAFMDIFREVNDDV